MIRKSETVNYWHGLAKYLPEDLTSGKLYLATDTGEVYLDYTTSSNRKKRLQIANTKLVNPDGAIFKGPIYIESDPENSMGMVSKSYLDFTSTSLENHEKDNQVHITQNECDYWNQKVDKVSRKGLSENDFDDYYLGKLNDMAKNANVVGATPEDMSSIDNVSSLIKIMDIKVNGKPYSFYYPHIENIPGNAATASKFKEISLIDGFLCNGSEDLYRFAICDTPSSENTKLIHFDNLEEDSTVNFFVYFVNDVIPKTGDPVKLKLNDEEARTVRTWGVNLNQILKAGIYSFSRYSSYFLLRQSVDTDFESNEALSDLMVTYEQQLKLNSLEFGANDYTLPKANESTLGGVRIGNGWDYDSENGILSISKESLESILSYDTINPEDFTPEYVMELIGAFAGATESTNGNHGLVLKPLAGDQYSFLRGNCSWYDIDGQIYEWVRAYLIDKYDLEDVEVVSTNSRMGLDSRTIGFPK